MENNYLASTDLVELQMKILGKLTSIDNKLQNKGCFGQRSQTSFHIISKKQHDVNDVAS